MLTQHGVPIAPSGHYAHKVRPPLARSLSDAYVWERIEAIQACGGDELLAPDKALHSVGAHQPGELATWRIHPIAFEVVPHRAIASHPTTLRAVTGSSDNHQNNQNQLKRFQVRSDERGRHRPTRVPLTDVHGIPPLYG